MSATVNGRRVAIVDGLRTPFAKAGTDLADATTLDLSTAVVTELLARTGLDPSLVDRVVFGSVVQDVHAPNIAREIVLATPLPDTVDAYSVTRACATSTQTTIDAAQAILLGDIDVAIVGGADSLSNPPVTFSPEFVDVMMAAQAARDLPTRLTILSRLRPRDLAPNPPAIADRSTGETMGQGAEKMARDWGITREEQDRFALESHRRAVEAWEKGVYDAEVMPFAVPPRYEKVVERDTSSGRHVAREARPAETGLRPPLRHHHRRQRLSLTDGAAALILMEEQTARRLGYEPKAIIRSYATAAVDPRWQLLIGPALATPVALDRAGLTLEDIDVIDIHEAFAAQVLAVRRAFASAEFARQHLGRDEPIGEIPNEKLNIYGGSISLGHPFGATGARQLLTMANELVRRDRGTALVSQCAAGGLGATVILER